MDHENIDSRNDGLVNLLQPFEKFPEEILEIVHLEHSPQFLDLLSASALKPRLTLGLFIHYEPIFADSSARWISQEISELQNPDIIGAFARILPLAPHLAVYLERYLESSTAHFTNGKRRGRIDCLYGSQESTEKWSATQLQRVLLAVWRILNFDNHSFSRTISAIRIQQLLGHSDRAVRLLASKVFSLVTSASDSKLDAMILENVGDADAVIGDFDGGITDLGFISIIEEHRLKDAADLIRKHARTAEHWNRILDNWHLSPLVLRCGNFLLPRINGPPTRPSSLIPTATACQNSQKLCEALLSPTPILIHGLAGSGKTSLVKDFARQLGVDSTMVTLHLNEQTDAKMLIGTYATGSKPGTFTWRAGVLTTAVREGRWVFIEDLDRAPNEVISVILPLIERKELYISSRGEIVRAGPGFRLIASVRTCVGLTGRENSPAVHTLGARLWQRVPVQMPSQHEFREIIGGVYPVLHHLLPGIISVYEHLYTLFSEPKFASRSRSSLARPISPRDLMKWCRRLDAILKSTGARTGQESISESTKYEMFLEATDCFAGALQTQESGQAVISCIAEEMHIDPQRVEHFLTAHNPKFLDSDTQLKIGRARLPKTSARKVVKLAKKSKPFANTTHAKRLLEQVGRAVMMSEPVLLVGETGLGKTAVVQQLADLIGVKLVAVNLSQQSEVGDLLGGFKPVNLRNLAIPLKEEFDVLFALTGFSITQNERYLEHLRRCIGKSQWKKGVRLWREAPKMYEKVMSELAAKEAQSGQPAIGQPLKRRKIESRLQTLRQLRPRWERFLLDVDQFEIQLSGGLKGFAFSFVEGNIVKAARSGDWVLLDEINLASPDTLESIADLLHSGPDAAPSLLLTETGEIERIQAHPDFRIFAAMNPATDVGKRDLPVGLRSRFTEIYVQSPDRNFDDLLGVINAFLKDTGSNDERAAHDIARLYLNTKRLADENRIVDGANQVPHFSLRTLTRVLSYVTEIAPTYGLRRALYEGFAMGFLTLLDRESERMLVPLIDHHLLESHSNSLALLSQTPRRPEDGMQYVRFWNKRKDRQYWMRCGSEVPVENPHYIITPFVERNMLNLVRATSTRRFPVLIQGPTSSGKTSMIEFLAMYSGNKFVRINNHEHTDLQEYLGSYISDSEGQLRFQEGLLVQALRHGHWIVLDELNLAPTDVLEALNRLLDDNRELLVPETQETVRPHENFMLFATQNPPGLYGGRKILSRAFRNRFLELHFDDIPEEELDFILEKRSPNVAPSDCRRIVAVYKELSRLRQSNRLFEQKNSFATLRDLFRWALRDADTREELAANGYMLLAERVRNNEERKAVKDVIEKVFRVKIDSDALYDTASCPEIGAFDSRIGIHGVIWTKAMRRLYILVAKAVKHNEPVLLIGETGCGKTTVCQILADSMRTKLHIVNAHENTETGDLIGAQRPIRNRSVLHEQLKQKLLIVLQTQGVAAADIEDLDSMVVAYQSLLSNAPSSIPVDVQHEIRTILTRVNALFEWSDGSLVHAMKEGQHFLLDEISLADDSVLERLNSVLEPQRTLLLAEKGVDASFVQAAEGFQFLATMNPGGDYGKRELSLALRNRFTEIWVPVMSEDDVFQIVEAKLIPEARRFSRSMVKFATWFSEQYCSSASASRSVRDALAWVKFIGINGHKDVQWAIVHGAAMVFIDTLGANPAGLLAVSSEIMEKQKMLCIEQLSSLLQFDTSSIYYKSAYFFNSGVDLTIGDFSLPKRVETAADLNFALQAPTTTLNAMRVIRALELRKPILLEGNPGVGKTTLIAALARATGTPLTRINLSDQTDLMDLFGSDVPVEAAEAGHFAWRDAPFLQAMQRGEWVLLDEMNLASQSVLEGLNACLDHRGEAYISELDQTFRKHPEFRVFAAQNPHHQGGGRKGLPSSFVNRFTVVYADVLSKEDLTIICRNSFPTISQEIVVALISFVTSLETEVVRKRHIGIQGGPWEFNLRDILRWLQLLSLSTKLPTIAASATFLNFIFTQRFRTVKDRQEVRTLFEQICGASIPYHYYFHNLTNTTYQVGMACLPRDILAQRQESPKIDLPCRLAEIESIMMCILQNIPCILVGAAGSGKSIILQHIAAACGKQISVFPLNADIDTIDLVGGFEQVDQQRSAAEFLLQLQAFISERLLELLPSIVPEPILAVLDLLKNVNHSDPELFAALYKYLCDLRLEFSFTGLGYYITTCKAFAESSRDIAVPRFEWVDGALVKAVEKGEWLVLDNANLCSSSVLDRLNSLLEPNGSLIVNEHSDSDGRPRIVIPHPNFRVFLTVNPTFGELSRSMRNRAIEICLEQLSDVQIAKHPVPKTKSEEASMQRLHNFASVAKSAALNKLDSKYTYRVALDNLAWSDIPLLPRLMNSLLQISTLSSSRLLLAQQYYSVYKDLKYERLRREIGHLAGSFVSPVGHVSMRDAQIMHPLQNSPLVSFMKEDSEPQWLGYVFELSIDTISAINAMASQSTSLEFLKPSQMNRLQRSLVGDHVKVVLDDSTIFASQFLSDVLLNFLQYLENFPLPAAGWWGRRSVLSSVQRFWWDTYDLTTTKSFDEAAFQAQLAIGSDLLIEFSNTQVDGPELLLIHSFQSNLIANFESRFKLSSGRSMEILWKYFRPYVIPKRAVLEKLLALEKLAARFDALRWSVSASIKELGEVMESFIKSYKLSLITNVDDELGDTKHLQIELERLEADAIDGEHGKPFFTLAFAALRQYDSIRRLCFADNDGAAVDLDLMVLSGYSTSTAMLLSSGKSSSTQLQNIDRLWGDDDTVYPIVDDFTPSLILRLHEVQEVDLKSLDLLQSDLLKLGEKLAQSSEIITQDQRLNLNCALSQILETVIAAHDDSSLREYKGLVHSIRVKIDFEKALPNTLQEQVYELARQLNSSFSGLSHLAEVILENFVPAAIALTASEYHNSRRMGFSAVAWTLFAEGCIQLYVPDRIHDPDKRQRLQRSQYLKNRADLDEKLSGLKEFERLFTGQDSNLRCQLLQAEIQELGPPPEVLAEVFRPEISELEQLQGEFNNLLKTAGGIVFHGRLVEYLSSPHNTDVQELELLQRNVFHLIRRLSDRFQSYRDLALPAISMLRCLQIGILFAIQESRSFSGGIASDIYLMHPTAFLGSTENSASSGNSEVPSEDMRHISAIAAVEGISRVDTLVRDLLVKTFHKRYVEWSKTLEFDQLKAQSKTGLYKFKGSAENEIEEDAQDFNELFPQYDEESQDELNAVSKEGDTRRTAVELANIHAGIFLGGQIPEEQITLFIRDVASQAARKCQREPGCAHNNSKASLIPGAMLLIRDHIEVISHAPISSHYNFYTDANLPETRKLVKLICNIQSRFQQLKSNDEIGHMQPIEDVLLCSRELLSFRYAEPLAKIITKVEKVHSYLYEWQFGGWASRANSARLEYDSLTTTIVDWRRLELSTWAKLLDIEFQKCQDDAKAWWFIAYQVAIAAPLQISDSEEQLRDYAVTLLRELETYFETATIGQYSQRITLLRQLEKHLDLLISDHPYMSIIHNAIANFLSFYSRFQNLVDGSLRKRRATLEAAMKEVLLLASWKDTNIVALRDSAKRSHHKLFKIVRKFRKLLNESMEPVIKQGLPDEDIGALKAKENIGDLKTPEVDESAILCCERSISNWKHKNKRFLNISKTVKIMARACDVPLEAIQGPEQIESFVDSTITLAKELKKLTPSVLNEDNKAFVKHLKTRKRKLYADTLKELRTMGIKHNLGTDAIAAQESQSAVLSKVSHIIQTSWVAGSNDDYYFFKCIDSMRRSREASREHSQDISKDEVMRSIGFLEGMLQMVLFQRNVLAEAIDNARRLVDSLKIAMSLWAPTEYSLQLNLAPTSHAKVLRWLPHILNVSIELVETHAKLGNIDCQNEVKSITSWSKKFTELRNTWDSTPQLPSDLTTTKKLELELELDSNLEDLNTELTRMKTLRPDLAITLSQIEPWTKVHRCPTKETIEQVSLSVLEKTLSTLCDGVMVAVQTYRESNASLPTSTEATGWLAKLSIGHSRCVKSLHCNTICEFLDDAFGVLKALDFQTADVSSSAGAIFAVALPILHQYSITVRRTVSEYSSLHESTCKMLFFLSQTFIQIANEGFCTPSEKPDTQDGVVEKLEGGTGLGDGDGAEDISKDIPDDEDLDELAQEANGDRNKETEDQDDAMNMGDVDMDGEMSDADVKSDNGVSDGDESQDDIDEETGDVDDLDPSAIDEKMWDEQGEQADKEQEGNDTKGKKSMEEAAAVNDGNRQQIEEAEEAEEADSPGAEQGEEIDQQDIEKRDPHNHEGEALDLPEDMELDGEDEEGSVSDVDSEMDRMSDIGEDVNKEEEAGEVPTKRDDEDVAFDDDTQEGQNLPAESDGNDSQSGEDDDAETIQEADADKDQDGEENSEDNEGLLADCIDTSNTNVDNAAPSDVQGVGEDQDESAADEQTKSATKAQGKSGAQAGNSGENAEEAAMEGEISRQINGAVAQNVPDDTQNSVGPQPFKKLGDALEKWHRQQIQAHQAAEESLLRVDQMSDEVERAAKFEHLQDDTANADAQALGTATEDEAHGLDESMAIDAGSDEIPDQFPPDELENQDSTLSEEADLEFIPKSDEPKSEAYEGRAGAIIRRAKPDQVETPESKSHVQNDIEDIVKEVDDRLELTHLETPNETELRPDQDAGERWTHFENSTRDLSLSLTEQLRLILAPTLATKMRGDFRTGKRLNIKRIIPYIASQYKRDKIWMRRSIPSKRSYQIMLAVDDSKSMGESGSGALALETLVMVSKSLSMLEVGEICIIGFGEGVKVAHDFETPFSSDAGSRLFQRFSFDQKRTDVTNLVKESIEMFRVARSKASGNPADLWQVELIISDGVCDSSEHDAIRRLLREALEERIMMVFVIVDDVKGKNKGESVMDLKEAKFVKDEVTGVSNVKIERYLDTFPFQYYLIVSDVKELPGVLSALLRQWFAEVVDSSN